MSDNVIRVINARVHNLKGVTLDIPRDKLVVFTGVSGSGKSSLVFDTLHTEAQRQLVETFSSFARRRLPKLSRPDVDEIHNLRTSIVIDQKPMGRTLRSTVGTATEVYTYLRMLYSRCGVGEDGAPVADRMASFHLGFNHPEGMCQACKGLGKRIGVDVGLLLDTAKTLREGAVAHPHYNAGAWAWREMVGCELFENDRPLREWSREELDRLLWAETIPITRHHGAGVYSKTWEGIARKLERVYTNRAEDESPDDEKDAYERFMTYGDCEVCGGLRLNPRALGVRVAGVGIGDAVQWEVTELDAWLATLEEALGGPAAASPAAVSVAAPLVRKMRSTLSHLIDIGVGYLSLHRSVSTLSGGESQRVKMARQLDCDLTGLMYVLDEPSVGLHPRDIDQLIVMLRRLRDRGNSVLVVEHDPAVIAAADYVVEIGPGAGQAGGQVCFAGEAEEFLRSEQLTARMMREGGVAAGAGQQGGHEDGVRGRNQVAARGRRRPWSKSWRVRAARVHNLKGFDVEIPQQVLVCVTGVAGSGKSTLVHEVFARERAEMGAVDGERASGGTPVVIDQKPIGRSSRSNPLTYLGIFDQVRKAFAAATGQPASLFSFNSDGACPTCKGQGSIAVEMSFLDDVRTECPDCRGRRYTDAVLALHWQGLNIHDVLSLTASEELELGTFAQKPVRQALELLCEVGLDYVTLGQPLSTLSGGECQRLKLASELGKSGNLYILDEPTTGLHLADIARLMGIMRRLVEDGNSVVVIEHNLDVIAQADWVIDLGPEGGRRGGELVACGTPEMVAGVEASWTGRALRAKVEVR